MPACSASDSCVILVRSVEPQFPASPKISYVRCGTLYDGQSDSARKNVTLRIAGDKIDQIGETRTAGKAAPRSSTSAAKSACLA